jgi:peptide deformylase
MKFVFRASLFLLVIMIIPFITVGWLNACQKKFGNVSNFSSAEIELITEGNKDQKMRLLNLFIYEDSIRLRKNSSNINLFNDPHIEHLSSRMYKTVSDPQNSGVGIAAPQVGINKKIIFVKRFDKPGQPFEAYLNARITAYSDTLVLRQDGCLSIPGISGQSWRAIWVEVKYNLQDGQQVTEKITHQYTAHIFQHEIDHLNGIVWFDRTTQNKQPGKTYLEKTNTL